MVAAAPDVLLAASTRSNMHSNLPGTR
jgi:hypothetical protein